MTPDRRFSVVLVGNTAGITTEQLVRETPDGKRVAQRVTAKRALEVQKAWKKFLERHERDDVIPIIITALPSPRQRRAA